ncbi:MAG: hypothetical protein KIT32_12000, partial [Rhodocyclaceae bacterium]|nr:hypothetical protein [Rhodocyclaceae bacterium]
MAHGGKRKGAGRKKGSPNGNTHELRTMILGALDQVGGIEYLAARAEDTPTAFLSLIGKVLPLQHEGGDGGPISLVYEW